MGRIKSLLIALFLLAACHSYGQKVGLVLSGGGAKGLYHIGVLKALEENSIPIDYVAGTSMGAIVGGLYSIGLSPDEIAAEFISPQIQIWLSGKIEDKYRYYFKQMRRTGAMLNMHLDTSLKHPTSIFSSSIVPSNQLDLAFISFFAASSVACGNDFDKLMVPFRCVASDIVGRRPVVFRDGDLGKAVRASMSIPVVFTPIKEDSTMLYDGGMFNNFPWQVLEKDFDPDILIGSKCVPTNKNFEEIGIAEQIFSLTMLSTDYNLPEDKGILLERILDDVSTMDFAKAKEVIVIGYKDALERMDEIKARIGRRVDSTQVNRKREEFNRRKPELLFNNVDINGLNPKQETYVNNLLGLRDQNHIFDFDFFKEHYFKILADGQITGEYPEAIYNPQSGYFKLKIEMKTKPALKLLIGGNISSTALNQAYLGLEYRNISRSSHLHSFDGYFSPFYSSVTLGTRTDFFIRSPFYYEFGLSYNHYNYFRSNFGYISRLNNMSYAKYTDWYLTGAFGWPIARQAVANIRISGVSDHYSYYLGDWVESDPMDQTRFQFVGAKLEIERNSIPNAYAIKGLRQSISAIVVDGNESFYPASDDRKRAGIYNRYWFGARFVRENYIKWNWLTVGYLIDAVYTTHTKFSNDYATNITSPAFNPTPHSKMVYMKEFRAPAFAAAGVMPSFEFIPNLYLKCSAFAFLPQDYDKIVDNIRQRFRYIFDASLIYQTPIGPASLSLSKYDVSRNNWFLTFNFGLSIFSPKGLFY